MNGLVLLPVTTDGNKRFPKYLYSRYNPTGLPCHFAAMDYGFMPSMLVNVKFISDLDWSALISYLDVYDFPSNLDLSISPQDDINEFCESISIPTNWTTPSTTYREFLRDLAGMFQFMQRYSGKSGGQTFLGDGITLDSRYRNLSSQQKTWFDLTVESFGYSSSVIQQNATFRQMLKQVGDAWNDPFYLGGLVF